MMPEEIVRDLKSNGCDVSETSDLLSVLGSSDVVYMTRIQRERFPDVAEYEKVAEYTPFIKSDDLANAPSNLMIMHPLPRVSEIHPSIDSTSHAWYFKQAFNGVPTRMALLCRSLGVPIPR